MVYKKFGKRIDVRNINRDINGILNMIENTKESSSKNLNNEQFNKKCPLCECSKSEFFVDVYNYIYNNCNNCDSIFLTNIPNTQKLYTDENCVKVEHYVNEELFKKRVNIIAKPKVEYIINVIEKLKLAKDLWIDIGCGVGEILYEVSNKYNIDVIGIESDKREIMFAREKGINILEGFISPDNDDNDVMHIINKADIISLFNVLEHIENPRQLIDYLHKNMKKGAILVFEVPRYPSLASFTNLIGNNNVYRHIVPPQHLFIFSEKSIDVIVENKFEIISKWGFGQGFFDILTNSVIESRLDNLNLYNKLLDISNEVQYTIDSNGFSDQMIFILKKI